ncbi:MAG: hypothetical protein Q3992_00670 [Bacteroides sp.]|nr:hypothetical protein [Bacteroides sp.]
MKKLLKNLGLLLILIGVAMLVVLAFTGNVNNNTLLVTPVAIMVIGIIAHILLNKNIKE